VTGVAERRVAPDMATLRLQVVAESPDAVTAREQADAGMARVIAVLRAAGIGDDDVDSTGLAIAPQYRWLQETREQQLSGYQVTRSALVRVLALDGLGPLLQQLSEAGVNRMQPPQLGLQDEEGIHRELLAAAVRSARERAAVAAGALGETLGPVVALDTGAALPAPPRPMERMVMSADAASGAASDSYSAGLLDYRVSVSASFALRD
jgi:uncharacterized protein YggE